MPSQADVFALFKQSLESALDRIEAPSVPLVLVAVSGGIDSMVLLDLTYRYCQAAGAKCHVVHVNHGVRPVAKRDEDFVRKAASALGLPFTACSLRDDRAISSGHDDEGELRRLRYEALFAEVKAHNASGLLVGHHADDQLETVLWRLIRGTSPTGMVGIRALSFRGGTAVIRPLLGFSRVELEQYAELRGIGYVEDETNFSLQHTRNVLRHNVIPQIKEINPSVLASVNRYAAVAQSEDEWLEAEAQKVVDAATVQDDGAVTVDISKLHAFPLPLQRRAIKIILYCLASVEWTFQHVADILRLTTAHSASAYIQLPHGFIAQKTYGLIRMGPEFTAVTTQHVTPLGVAALAVEWPLGHGQHHMFVPDANLTWQFSCRNWEPSDKHTLRSQWTAVIPAIESIVLRLPRQGDRIQPLGMNGTKKLQDVFVDAKVERHLRSGWPVVCSADEIIWIPGLVRSRHLLLGTADNRGWSITCQPPPIEGMLMS